MITLLGILALACFAAALVIATITTLRLLDPYDSAVRSRRARRRDGWTIAVAATIQLVAGVVVVVIW